MTEESTKKRLVKRQTKEISPALVRTVCRRLERNLRVRRTLPGKGRLHIDRQLPFLCVYRRPSGHEDTGTQRLVKGEASYLIAPGGATFRKSVSELVRQVVKTLAAEFGAFLIVEIWAGPDGGKENDPAVPTVLPKFAIHAAAGGGMAQTVEMLERGLQRIKVLKQGVEVVVVHEGKRCPPDMPALLTKAEARELNCSTIGLAVPPVYRQAHSTREFPLLIRELRHRLSVTLRRTYFEFSRLRTTHRPPHYHSLGRRAVVKAVWEIDRQLAAVSNQFDYLLQLTPVNTTSAWKQFRRERFERVPEFHYRPLPVDPNLLKRELYRIPIERVEDPALQRLFQEKQEELELKITMLRDRDTRRFIHESQQLFGGVDDGFVQVAKDLLSRLAGKSRREAAQDISAPSFLQQVEAEFARYREACPDFKARVQMAADVSGLIVSRGKLLINSDLKLSRTRIEALLAHEVGTHLVTYYNGRLQPFQQLYAGLAGYEELQEGLAVLSEYLVDGLSRSRMRQLAARVVAVRHLTDGASFIETFRSLVDDFGFAQQPAYNITMRVYRGGGLTKDAVYLRGLQAILRYVSKGGDLNPLLVGKLAVDHIPIIKELQYRNVLKPVPIVPRYLQDATSLKRLEQLRGSNASVLDLVS
jgi:uncharacterized protein (TIGR02421 family)